MSIACGTASSRLPHWGFFVCGVGLTAAALTPALGQSMTQSPAISYGFFDTASDGMGGFIIDSGGPYTQHTGGGDLMELYTIPPPPPLQTTIKHMLVVSNEAGTNFWSSARSSVTRSPPSSGDNIGGRAVVSIGHKFRKDADTASVKFEITEATLSAFGPADAPVDNKGVIGQIIFNLAAFVPGEISPYQNEGAVIRLDGRPTQYDFQSGNLDVRAVLGGKSDMFIEIALQQKHVFEVDLTQFNIGDEFNVSYSATAWVIDTIQTDTWIEVQGHDPLSPSTGTVLTFQGVTPLGPFVVPEPTTAMILGLALLALMTATRRDSVRTNSSGQ